jgi:DinB family protein
VSGAFTLDSARQVLSRTPAALTALLGGLGGEWTLANEGPGTWSPFDVVGHLIHGERADWIPRLHIVLEKGTAQAFTPFDRVAMFKESAGRSLPELLEQFAELRAQNLRELDRLQLMPRQLDLEGLHPELGVVTVRQLLSTWVAHDLDHVVQIARVLAKRYAGEVGPWTAYLRVLQP